MFIVLLVAIAIAITVGLGQLGITSGHLRGPVGVNESVSMENTPTQSAARDREAVSMRLNRTLIEKGIHQVTNKERTARGLPPLQNDPQLNAVASYYSRRQTVQQFFAHTGPDGQTFVDRYRLFGITCRIPVGPNQIATGAENIAFTYAASNVVTERGIVNYQANETRIARGIVSQWMHSSGHRDNILNPHWKTVGVGVAMRATANGTRVYATQNFC